MKTYVGTTAVLFGLLTLIHVWRLVEEGGPMEPWFLALTAASGALCLWAVLVLRRSARSSG